MKTYSMNDTVYYRLTRKGEEIWNAENERMKREIPSLGNCISHYHGFWIKDYLWMVLKRFGAYGGSGITDITFDDPSGENV